MTEGNGRRQNEAQLARNHTESLNARISCVGNVQELSKKLVNLRVNLHVNLQFFVRFFFLGQEEKTYKRLYVWPNLQETYKNVQTYNPPKQGRPVENAYSRTCSASR